MLFELRRYELRPGTRAAWVDLFENEIAPFQSAQGVAVIGSFTSETEPDVFYWIRRFDDEAARVRLYAAIYESPEWVDRIKPKIEPMLIREAIQVTRLNPTPRSVLR
jgi:quinol monooxygenase YgiN